MGSLLLKSQYGIGNSSADKKHPSATQGWRLNKALTLNPSCATSSLQLVAMITLGRKESGSSSISCLFSLFPITNDASSSNSDNGLQITARVYPNLVTLERNNKKPLHAVQLQSKAQFIQVSPRKGEVESRGRCFIFWFRTIGQECIDKETRLWQGTLKLLWWFVVAYHFTKN